MTTHGAYICKINVKPHPNADKLALGQVGGFQVVVSLDTQDGDIGVFFSSELKVSPEYADANKLRKADGGYFDANLRVRAQSFRKEKSEGYYAPLSSLAFTGADLSKLKVGDIITELNGVTLCEKYYTPATLRSMSQGKSAKSIPSFPKHYDTEQLAYYYPNIPPRSVVWYTLKMHGTSQRTGRVLVETKVKAKGLLNRLRRRMVATEAYQYVSGTRNTVLGQYDGESSKNFRRLAADMFDGKLHEGEIVYYELVGWEDEGATIMGKHHFSKTNDFKKWGDNVIYSYGQMPGTFGVYIYRITRMTRDAYGQWIHTDLTWPQVVRRCGELGMDHVPTLVDYPHSVLTPEDVLMMAEQYCDGSDPTDESHPREGVALHILTPDGKTYCLKHKGMTFKVGEGIAKEKDDYVDAEEVS